MGQNARAFARALERADDVKQVGVVALLGWWLAPLEALEGVGRRREAGAPGLVRERRIGDNIVVGAEMLAVLELRRGESVARQDEPGQELHTGEGGTAACAVGGVRGALSEPT